jgi:hypothetical protein
LPPPQLVHDPVVRASDPFEPIQVIEVLPKRLLAEPGRIDRAHRGGEPA